MEAYRARGSGDELAVVSGCTTVVLLVSANKSKECSLSSRNAGYAAGLRDKATVVSRDRRGGGEEHKHGIRQGLARYGPDSGAVSREER